MENAEPTKIKLTASELIEISRYIDECLLITLDTEMNNTSTYIIYKWHLIELHNKITKAFIKCAWTSKSTTLKINEIEQHVMAVFFNINEAQGYMIVLQQLFTKGLIKLKHNAA